MEDPIITIKHDKSGHLTLKEEGSDKIETVHRIYVCNSGQNFVTFEFKSGRKITISYNS